MQDQRSFPLNDIQLSHLSITKKFPNRDAKLLIGCDIGGLLHEEPSRRYPSMSFEAMFFLKNLGYTNVKYLKGGFCAWRNDEKLLAKTVGMKGELVTHVAQSCTFSFGPMQGSNAVMCM
eukprot:978390-Prorocentrum_minimum.AAC.4